MAIQEMEDMVICWRKILGVRWMVQCLPTDLLYCIHDHPGHMSPGIVKEEKYTLPGSHVQTAPSTGLP